MSEAATFVLSWARRIDFIHATIGDVHVLIFHVFVLLLQHDCVDTGLYGSRERPLAH